MGLEGFEIGDTVSDLEKPEALKSIKIDEPTMSMLFTINNSPFYGKEGKYVTSRHIKDRLDKELEKNLALKVGDTGSADSFLVFGRGVLHLSVLIETMRREGYELQIGQPQVIFKEIDGVKCEPIEELTIDLPESVAGKAIETVSQRKGEMKTADALDCCGKRQRDTAFGRVFRLASALPQDIAARAACLRRRRGADASRRSPRGASRAARYSQREFLQPV